jgi:branched-chain amino acid transport system substrate-binding protein
MYRFFASLLVWAAAGAPALAQTVKVGLIETYSGPTASFGQNVDRAVKLYVKLHEDVLPKGVQVEIITRDDGGANPDRARQLAQELIVRDKVQFLTGFAYSPNAAAVAPLVTEAQIPTVLMNAGGSSIVGMSPWFVRTSFGIGAPAYAMGTWAAKKYKRILAMVTDYSPGLDAESMFETAYKAAGGGELEGKVHMPLSTADFTPFMQRAKDIRPDAIFSFVPGGRLSSAMLKAYADLDLAKAGIPIIGTGDLTADDELAGLGDVALGLVTAYHYSAAGDRPANRGFVAAWQKEYGPDSVPNFMSVGAWDGMDAIYRTVAAQAGKVTAERSLELLKHWKSVDSPRGPASIDPETRDMRQNQYLREVRKVNGRYVNVETEVIVKDAIDPWHALHKK